MRRAVVSFVEGKGDVSAVPTLVRRVIDDVGASDVLFADREPFRGGNLGGLVKDDYSKWIRMLGSAGKTRRGCAGVLLVLDGDVDRVPSTWSSYVAKHQTQDFCAWHVAALLGEAAQPARAGDAFSLAIVFAMKEFETWLLAGIESLRGLPLAEGRGRVPRDAALPGIELEGKRGAKELLAKLVPGYQQTLDQAALADGIDLAAVRARCRSFSRLDSAIRKLADAARRGRAIVSPSL